MKKLLLGLLLNQMSFYGFAQLRVATDGRALINASSSAPYSFLSTHTDTAIKGLRTSYCSEWGYGIYGRSENFYAPYSVGVAGIASTTSGNVYKYGRAYGIWGEADSAGEGYNYGVFAKLGKGHLGSAIYATTNRTDTGEKLLGCYAGYFSGYVHITEGLSVEGNITCDAMYAPGSSANAAYLNTDNTPSFLSDKVASLSLITSYKDYTTTSTEECSEIQEGAGTPIVQETNPRLQYSLSGEQMEELFPELVYTQQNGTKLINYTGLIPILIRSIAELKREIEELRGGNGSMLISSKGFTTTTYIQQIGSNIEIDKPVNIKRAYLLVYNQNGIKVFEKEIPNYGINTFSLYSMGITKGTYIYTLIGDGQIVESRKTVID